MDGYAESDLVRISILVNGDLVDALSFIAHRAAAENRGRQICARLKDLIPKQLFKIAIQARHRQPGGRPRDHQRPVRRT